MNINRFRISFQSVSLNIRLCLFAGLIVGCTTTRIDPPHLTAEQIATAPDYVEFHEASIAANFSLHAYDEKADFLEYVGQFHPKWRLLDTQSDLQKFSRYYLLINVDTKQQMLVIRGSENERDIARDADIPKISYPKLGADLHQGFALAANRIYKMVNPMLTKSRPLLITGHSLGGAIAVIVQMHLVSNGFEPDHMTVITFGQPKVTNLSGAYTQAGKNITRYINQCDTFTQLPPLGLISNIAGTYRHFGVAVYLLEDEKWSFVPEPVARREKSGWDRIFASSPTDHRMAEYDRKISLLARTEPSATYFGYEFPECLYSAASSAPDSRH